MFKQKFILIQIIVGLLSLVFVIISIIIYYKLSTLNDNNTSIDNNEINRNNNLPSQVIEEMNKQPQRTLLQDF